ncbi:hypothetical protein KNP414_04575 [Paenibacillus mucilaginosus KNP414]|uniref:Uncharacterized protein n=1 Tax=Paenibacillus mucilaginosus (strain KNP414) TaxID=1036673 RepID=F8FBQ4_PAEMK|nr:hypothetical protein KNP414_04575 [Paenibacillus mucilaginosus KNP414]
MSLLHKKKKPPNGGIPYSAWGKPNKEQLPQRQSVPWS